MRSAAKTSLAVLLVTATFASIRVLAQTTNVATAEIVIPGTLTAEQLAALKTEAVLNEKDGTRLVFTGAFTSESASPAEAQKIRKRGKAPIRITCDFAQEKTRMGRVFHERQNGSVELYILDPDGKLLISQKMPLDKMCPS